MEEQRRLQVERRLADAGREDGVEMYVGTWQLKDEDEERLRQNDPEACSSRRRVAVKILTCILPEGGASSALNKLEKERMMAKKREASVLKRLAHLQVPFLIEMETIFKINDWPNAKLQFLPRAQEGSTSGENLKEEKAEGSGAAHNLERLAGDGDETSKKEETEEAAIVLVMAYHEQSLFDYLERRQRERLAGPQEDQGLDLHEALVILKQMATAVAHCHRHSVCHRGTSPAPSLAFSI
jgi:serine/threonine protein kinase